MKGYYVIITEEDNSIYKVFHVQNKESAKHLTATWAEHCFVVILITHDCFRFSESDIVKRARKFMEDDE